MHRHGIQNIYHASFADEEALDLLEAAKDRISSPGHRLAHQHRTPCGAMGIKPGSPVTIEYERELEMCVETMKKMHRRGIRICIGAITASPGRRKAPTPRTSRPSWRCWASRPWSDLAATKFGGEIMGMGKRARHDQGGLSRRSPPGRRDPIADVRILQAKSASWPS